MAGPRVRRRGAPFILYHTLYVLALAVTLNMRPAAFLSQKSILPAPSGAGSGQYALGREHHGGHHGIVNPEPATTGPIWGCTGGALPGRT